VTADPSTTAIVANSVLPARREALRLQTSDGLTLVGELAQPESQAPVATLICVHPLPTHGGMMDSHLLRKMAWRLPALAQIAVLRFNSRGTSSAAGTSDGDFDAAIGEQLDLQAAIDFAVRRGLPNPWVVGWSFGTDVILKFGATHPEQLREIRGAILLSPPLRYTSDEELLSWARSGTRLICLVPEFDDYLPAEPAKERFAVVPQADVIVVPQGRHLWVGERFVRIVLDEITSIVAPEHAPLPPEWSGPMTRWSDL
jgi:alpha/beta superfamily hydrolase